MRPIRFGLIGEFQSGKSLLTNCLLRRPVATVGGGSATTHTVVNYRYGECEYVEYLTRGQEHQRTSLDELAGLDKRTDIERIDVYLTVDMLKYYTLTDMPGFGANTADNAAAGGVLSEIDFAILIASSDKSFGAETESFKSLKALKERRIPYYFILNSTNIDRWQCDNDYNIMIARHELSMLSFYPPANYPLSDDGINIVNLMWYWYSICDADDQLINRACNRRAFIEYDINPSIKRQLDEASNFGLINKLFDMENRDFLELRRSIREEIEALKRELCPIGTIQAFAFNSIPEGWLVCDGGVLSISLFPQLFAAIGTVFGGNGETNFALPDLRGRFIRGWNADGDADPGRVFGSSQDDAIQAHAHNVKVGASTTGLSGAHTHNIKYSDYATVYDAWGDSTSDRKYITDSSYSNSYVHACSATLEAGSHSHPLPSVEVDNVTGIHGMPVVAGKETRPKNIALMFCIKAR